MPQSFSGLPSERPTIAGHITEQELETVALSSIDTMADKYLFIEHFISLKSQAIITPLTRTEDYCYHKSLQSFHRTVCVELSVFVISYSCLVYKCVCLSLSYIARLPNHVQYGSDTRYNAFAF